MNGFMLLEWCNGLLIGCDTGTGEQFYAWRDKPDADPPEEGFRREDGNTSLFGIALQAGTLVVPQGRFPLRRGMFFVTGGGFVRLEGGRGVLIEQPGHEQPFMLGGPIEREGRLRYIDGCTDSLLIPPMFKGSPCLNYLHFPEGIKQTMHTHPSDRLGCVLRGKGVVHTLEGDKALSEGMLWLIPADSEHCFSTSDHETMDVIAYHPDSDYGPEHEFHPMINRTVVDGKAASELEAIQTGKIKNADAHRERSKRRIERKRRGEQQPQA